MMKILFVCRGKSNNSISPTIKKQGESLIRKGVDLDYFAIRGKGVIGYVRSLNILREKLSRENYDIIHAHYGLWAILSCLARKSEKLVVSFMGSDLLGSKKLDGTSTRTGTIMRKINSYLAKYEYDYCIIKSNSMKAELLNATFYSVVPNGVDQNVFNPIQKEEARKTLNLDPRDIIIFFPSSPMRKEKNYGLLKEAFELLSIPNKMLVVAEDIPLSEMNLYYSAVDVLVLTSFHEGSPNVIKEAMACNCPIVSTDVGDVREVVDDTEGCFICSYDPIDLSSKILKAVEFGSRTNGRDKIKHLDISLIANRIVSIYYELAGST